MSIVHLSISLIFFKRVYDVCVCVCVCVCVYLINFICVGCVWVEYINLLEKCFSVPLFIHY